MIKKILSVLLMIGMLIVGSMIFFIEQEKASAIPANEIKINEWPSFTMIYEVSKISNTYSAKLDYDNKLHWRVETLSQSFSEEIVALETVGNWSEYNGTAIYHFDAMTGIMSENKDVPKDGVYIPEQWLSPYYIPKLLAQTNIQIISESNGTGTFVVTEYLSCDEDIRDYMQQQGLKPCTLGVNRVAKTEIKYRTDYNIPLSIIDTIDGEEVHRITVTELTISNK